MPLIKLQVSTPVPDEREEELLKALSGILVDCIGKPEKYVMAIVDTAPIWMSGGGAAAAFAEVKSIGGLNGEVNRNIANRLCELLQQSLQIPADRVYINYTDIAPGNWGFNGSTFG